MKTLDAKVVISRFKDGGESFANMAKEFKLTSDALRSRVKKAELKLYKDAMVKLTLCGGRDVVKKSKKAKKSKNGKRITDWKKGKTVTVKKSKNGKVLFTCRGFCRKQAALKGMTEEKLLALVEQNFPSKTSKRSEVRFAFSNGG